MQNIQKSRSDYLKVDLDLHSMSKWEAMYQCLKTLAYSSTYFHLTTHGVHICIPELPNDYTLRLMFGDDQNRIHMDMVREKLCYPTNVLFIAKNRKRVKTTRNIDEVIEWIKSLSL